MVWHHTCPLQVLGGTKFILKNLSYDSVHRADLFKLPCPPAALAQYLARPDVDISAQQPWIVQEFIEVGCECGRELSH